MEHVVKVAVFSLTMMTFFSNNVTAKSGGVTANVRMSVKEGIKQLNQFIKNGQTALAITLYRNTPSSHRTCPRRG